MLNINTIIQRFKLHHIFTIMVSVLMSIGIAAVSLTLIAFDTKALTERLEQKQLDLKEHLVQIAKEALITGDDLLFIHYVQIIRKTNPDILFVYLVTPEGSVLSDLPTKEIKGWVDEGIRSDTHALRQVQGKVVHEIIEHIEIEKNRKGILHIGFDHSFFMNLLLRQKQKSQKRVFAAASISLIFGIVLTLLVTIFLFAPIRRLSNGVRLIRKGILSQRIGETGTSELRELAHQFNHMCAQLEKLDEMKNNFISSVSHELKTPLAALSVYVDLLKEDNAVFEMKEKRLQTLDIMRQNINRLTLFISDILDLARIKAGKLELHSTSFNIDTVIKDITSFYKPIFEKNQVRLIYLNTDDPPLVKADSGKIRQVITNLIGNALKFISSGGELSISYTSLYPFLQVNISDTGKGIPQEQLKSIFEQFKKVSTDEYGPEGGKTKGTGLGLSICRGIIEAHGGKIWADSVLHKGSTFHFTLPLA